MKKALALLVLLQAFTFAQKVAQPYFNVQYFDNSGAPCVGCTVNTYAAGGTTPIVTYTDPTGGSMNANPVVLDSAGRGNIYLTPGTSYRFDLKTAGAVLLGSWDNQVASSLAGTATTTANYVYAGPTSGGATAPAFRLLVSADIPNNAANTSGVAATATAAAALGAECTSGQAARGVTTAWAARDCFQPAASGLAVSKITTGVTFSEYEYPELGPLVICVGTTGSAVAQSSKMSTPAAGSSYPTPTCRSGTNSIFGVALMTATTNTFQVRTILPDDWTTGAGNDLRIFYADVADTNTGHAEAFNVQTGCTTPGSTVDPTWNAAQIATGTVQSIAGVQNEVTLSTWTSTGCAAGYVLYLKVGLDSSRTATGNADVETLQMRVKVLKVAL